MYGCFVCIMSVYYICAWWLQRQEKGVRYETEVTNGCELPCRCLELDSGTLEEQPVFLASEPLPQIQIQRIFRADLPLCFFVCLTSTVWLFQPVWQRHFYAKSSLTVQSAFSSTPQSTFCVPSTTCLVLLSIDDFSQKEYPVRIMINYVYLGAL